jgi:hypothetical protein
VANYLLRGIGPAAAAAGGAMFLMGSASCSKGLVPRVT